MILIFHFYHRFVIIVIIVIQLWTRWIKSQCRWKHVHVCCSVCRDRSSTVAPTLVQMRRNLWFLGSFLLQLDLVARESNGVWCLWVQERHGCCRRLPPMAWFRSSTHSRLQTSKVSRAERSIWRQPSPRPEFCSQMSTTSLQSLPCASAYYHTLRVDCAIDVKKRFYVFFILKFKKRVFETFFLFSNVFFINKNVRKV